MVRGSSREGLERVRAEIQQEKAETLRRAGERLDGAIRALRIIRDEVEALERGRATPVDPVGAIDAAVRRRAEYAALRRQAGQYRQYLIIQREAVGFRKHGDVDRLYPLPPPLGTLEAEGREAS